MNSKCSDCQQKAHWGGDAVCPMVKSGKVKLRVQGDEKPHSSHMVDIVNPSAAEWVTFVEHVTDKNTLDMLHEVHDDTRHDEVYIKAFMSDVQSESESGTSMFQ